MGGRRREDGLTNAVTSLSLGALSLAIVAFCVAIRHGADDPFGLFLAFAFLGLGPFLVLTLPTSIAAYHLAWGIAARLADRRRAS